MLALVATAGIAFSWGVRPRQAGALIASSGTDPLSACSAASAPARRRLLLASTDAFATGGDVSADARLIQASALGASALIAVLAAILFVQAVIFSSDLFVTVGTWGGLVVMPALCGLFILLAGHIIVGALILALAAVNSCVIPCCWAKELRMVARLLSVSGRALHANPSVIWASIGLLLLQLLLWAPFAFFIFAAYSHGAVVPNPAAVAGAGCAPIWPAATCTFCACTAA